MDEKGERRRQGGYNRPGGGFLYQAEPASFLVSKLV